MVSFAFFVSKNVLCTYLQYLNYGTDPLVDVHLLYFIQRGRFWFISSTELNCRNVLVEDFIIIYASFPQCFFDLTVIYQQGFLCIRVIL